MPDADVTLDGQNCIVDGNWMLVRCFDIKLDAAGRRSGASGERRALLHGFDDELVLNWARDYPGGVACHGNLEVQKSGSLRLRSNAGNVTTLLDSSGNLYLGGGGVDGDVICRSTGGTDVFHVNAQARRMDLNDDTGSTRVRIGVDDFTNAAWPPWGDGSSPSRLDLVAELRRLKEEVLALKAEVAALGSGS